MHKFEDKSADETVTLEFDFSDEIGDETITSATCAVECVAGYDAYASGMLSGSAVIGSAGAVQQVLTAGSNGNEYLVTCTVSGATFGPLQLAGRIAIRKAS